MNTLLHLAGHAAGTEIKFNYKDQEAWADIPGSFCGCQRQSPINIDTRSVKAGHELVKLQFQRYGDRVSGFVENNGHSIQFNPSTKQAQLQNHKGNYVLQQFHFHWGKRTGEGSEHWVSNQQYDAEIHLVHLKESVDPSKNAPDTYSVIAVFGQTDEHLPLSGIWQQLLVPKQFKREFHVYNIEYTDLLPRDRDYYYYDGSLTTPLCNETVQWFILKHPIKIPWQFIRMLRQVEKNEKGELLTFNFRNVQDLNSRQVKTPVCNGVQGTTRTDG